jgi:SAM-dependent methyltransferase
MDNFSLYTKYYDLLYADKNYHAESDYIDSLLQNYSEKPKSILEFGSGTGSHGLLFMKKGYELYGIENSPTMVEIAKKNGYQCEVNDIEKFSLNREFDSIIALFHVVSYLTTNEKLINTFNNAFTHLKKGGLFIFDVWYTPAVYNLQPRSRIKKISNKNLDVIRIANPELIDNKSIVNVDYDIIVKDKISNNFEMFVEKHPMRHFGIQEIKLLAKLTGFEFVKSEEFLSGNTTSDKTWGVCFILKK